MMEVACQIWNRSLAVVVLIAACTVSGWLHADEVSAATEKPSPWLMVPLVTSNPKIDTSRLGLSPGIYMSLIQSLVVRYLEPQAYSAEHLELCIKTGVVVDP